MGQFAQRIDCEIDPFIFIEKLVQILAALAPGASDVRVRLAGLFHCFKHRRDEMALD